MAPGDISAHRVLVVGNRTHGIQLLCWVLVNAGITQIVHVDEPERAIELLRLQRFSAVYCDDGVAGVGGLTFPAAVRQMERLLNPMIPIFTLRVLPRQCDVEKARDAGVTDVLTTPISANTLIAKLQAATKSPRPFIVAKSFLGPDRRASSRPPFFGRDRRIRKTRKAKVDFRRV